MILNYPDGSNVTTRALIRERQEGQSENKWMMEAEARVMQLLEGAMSQEMRAASRNRKRQGMDSLRTLQRGTRSCCHLHFSSMHFSPVRPIYEILISRMVR